MSGGAAPRSQSSLVRHRKLTYVDPVGVRDTGTIASWIGPDFSGLDDDWATNDKTYRIAPVSAQGIMMLVVKNADRTLDITLTGALDQTFTFRVSTIPDPGPRGLHVALKWDLGQVKLYLSEKHVDTANA